MEKENGAGRFALELNLLMLFVMLTVSRPGFGGGEKRLKENLAADFEAAVSAQNGCLKYLYEVLQGWMDTIPWYALLQYVLLFCAFWAVTSVILHRMELWYGTMVSLLVLLYFGYECYLHLEAAGTAAVLSCAGLLLIFHGASEQKKSGRMFAAGWVLGTAGAMYQIRVFFVCALLLSGMLLYEIGSRRNRNKSVPHTPHLFCAQSCASLLAGCAGLLFLVLGSLAADRALYAQKEVWQMQREYHTVLKRLEDYGLPEYAQNQELYEKYGISKKKYRALRKGKGLEEFSLEELQALDTARGSERLSKALLILYMKRFLVNCFQSKTFFCALILAVFWIVWGRHQKLVFAVLGYEVFWLALLHFCLFYRMRENSPQNDLGLWLSLSLLLIWFLKEKAEKISGKVWLLLGLCLLLQNQKTWQKDWRLLQQTDEKIYSPFDVRGELLKELRASQQE